MRNFVLLVFMIFSCARAFASDSVLEPVCQILEPYTQEKGVEYTPGVDVHGKPLTPADLNAGTVNQLVFNPVIIPVEMDLAARYGLALPAGAEARPYIAEIEIQQDGKVFYNGQDITNFVRQDCTGGGKTVGSTQHDKGETHDEIK